MSPMGQRAMSKRVMHEEWETPWPLFSECNQEFRFTVDAAASPGNAKVEPYWTVETNGLAQDWRGHRVWLNPPYGHRNLRDWMGKAWSESRHGALVVCLVPSHTGQKWWQESVAGKASEIRWLPGKVKFVGADSCAPFYSCIVIYRPHSVSGRGGNQDG